MDYNPDKRLKKFTKNLFYFTSHPMFNKLKKLYVENDVKQLRTIENWFNKMNITKTGTINKKATSLVNKINDMYSKYDIKVINTSTYTYEKLAKSMDLGFEQPIFFTNFKIWIRKQMKKWQRKYNTNKFIVNIKYYSDDEIDPELFHDTYYLDFPTPNPQKNFYDYMEKHYWDFMLGSGIFKVEKRDKYIDTISFSPIDEINAEKTKQSFLDNVNGHCFLDPIVSWANKCIADSETKSTQKKYTAIINKIEKKWRPTFINGFDEDKIDDLCKDINVNIKVDLPFKNSNTQMIQSIGNKQPLKIFKFINTRFNHVNEMVSDSSKFIKNISIESYDDMNKLYKWYIDNGKFAICNKNSTGGIIKINTLTEIYTYTDKYIKTVMEFEKNNNINMYKLDYIKDNEVCKFIDHSIHFNTVCQFIKTQDNDLELDHIDQKQAYTQFKECDEYIGFLGNVTDFRKCDKDFALNNIGIYKIKNIKFFDNKMKFYNDEMKIYKNNCVYPSSDLLFLNKYANFDVEGGCYGIRFDFDFDPTMTYYKIDKIPYYAKYVGSISKISEYKSFYMNGNKKYFQNMLAHVKNTKISYDNETKQAQISYKKDYIPYKCHIASFILSYQRLHMLKQLMEMNSYRIIRVVTDGIYYYKHDFKINDTFRVKEVDDINKLAFYNECDKYSTNTIKYTGEFYNSMDHHRINYYYGEAGTGKSYSLMSDLGFVKVLYVAPPWKLCRQMKKDFPFGDVTVLARIINDTEESFNILSNYNVIIFDEVSQYTEKDKISIFKKCKHHKIFFVGDVGFQLPPASGSVMKINPQWYQKEFLINHRIQCEDLRALCSQLRIFISKGKSSKFINAYVLKNYKNKCIEDINNYCHTSDYILCSKNKCNKHHKIDCDCDGLNYALQWTKKFEHLDKYLVKANSLKYSNGDIVFEKVPNSFLCHAYSVHSVQGETMRDKIFIDMRNLFCPQMLYTAISRARRLDQLYFIV